MDTSGESWLPTAALGLGLAAWAWAFLLVPATLSYSLVFLQLLRSGQTGAAAASVAPLLMALAGCGASAVAVRRGENVLPGLVLSTGYVLLAAIDARLWFS